MPLFPGHNARSLIIISTEINARRWEIFSGLNYDLSWFNADNYSNLDGSISLLAQISNRFDSFSGFAGSIHDPPCWKIIRGTKMDVQSRKDSIAPATEWRPHWCVHRFQPGLFSSTINSLPEACYNAGSSATLSHTGLFQEITRPFRDEFRDKKGLNESRASLPPFSLILLVWKYIFFFYFRCFFCWRRLSLSPVVGLPFGNLILREAAVDDRRHSPTARLKIRRSNTKTNLTLS